MQTDIKKLSLESAICIAIMTIFIFSTDPSNMPAAPLLVLPVLVFVTTNVCLKLFMNVFTHLSQAKIKLLSVVLALGPALLVTLGSLGQIGLQDSLLAVLLISGLAWYLKRVRGLTNND